ncbi:MAG: hypothetical protein SGARI_005557, partial [Bacillariaceae sp.]
VKEAIERLFRIGSTKSLAGYEAVNTAFTRLMTELGDGPVKELIEEAFDELQLFGNYFKAMSSTSTEDEVQDAIANLKAQALEDNSEHSQAMDLLVKIRNGQPEGSEFRKYAATALSKLVEELDAMSDPESDAD